MRNARHAMYVCSPCTFARSREWGNRQAREPTLGPRYCLYDVPKDPGMRSCARVYSLPYFVQVVAGGVGFQQLAALEFEVTGR